MSPFRPRPDDPDGALRRLIDRILDHALLDDDAALVGAVREEARRIGMDPAPRAAVDVPDCGGDEIGLRRFLQAVREHDFDADTIKDEVLEEMHRMALAEVLSPAPGDAILHVPADRLKWLENQWFARRDDLIAYLPPGRPIPDVAPSDIWLPPADREMEEGLAAAGMDPVGVEDIVARYRAHCRTRWGVTNWP